MPTITINGQVLEFQPQESIIAAAARAGIEIPYYCWHPRLSVAANCRMCLVEVEKAPKLAPSCQTECKEGMVVHTENARAKDAQRAVMEFLLINHPIDCPICDQAGECKLQDYYMRYDLTHSRMHDRKVQKPRLEALGPHVLYNAERCIVCTRCVRFMEEVAHEPQLGIFHRGDHAEIGTFPGRPLDSAYSLNTVDVCPVGALTSVEFRFKQRVWNLGKADSICPGCARGCNVHVEHRSGQVYRLLPRENDHVNASWLCDEGRLTYRWPNQPRLAGALVRKNGVQEVTDAKTALERAHTLLRPGFDTKSGVAVLVSLQACLEEAYVAAKLARDGFGASWVGISGRPDGESDDILRLADKNPNRVGIERVVSGLGLRTVSTADVAVAVDCQVLVVIGDGVELDLLQTGVEVVIFIGAHVCSVSERADVALPTPSWAERDGTWVNHAGRAQRLTPAWVLDPASGVRPPQAWLIELARLLGLVWQLPSTQSVRRELQESVPAFAQVPLTELPSVGAAC